MKRLIADIYWDIIYFFQRLRRGYDERDSFDFCFRMCKKMDKPLRQMIDNNYSHPMELTEKQWEIILEKIYFSIHELSTGETRNAICRKYPHEYNLSNKTGVKPDNIDNYEKFMKEYWELQDRISEGFIYMGRYWQSIYS